MQQYLLDTNAVIALLNNKLSAVARRLRTQQPQDVFVSSIVMHELFYGAFKSQRLEKNLATVDALRFEILDFDCEDARQAGRVRALLAVGGTPIGPYDVLIAGQALARGLTLVTQNIGEFARVPNLRWEDWREG